MNQDEKICLEILKRGLRTVDYHPADFHGPAKKWPKFNEPDFQKFAAKHGIQAETDILIWDYGLDRFGVSVFGT